MSNANDPRLRQDKYERKDKENTSAGMLAGVAIVILGVIGLYIYFTYEAVPVQTTVMTPQPAAVVTPATTTVAPAATSTTAPATNSTVSPSTPAANTTMAPAENNAAPATTPATTTVNP